jgi:hypothetical protein
MILFHKWHNHWTKRNTKLNTIKNNIQVWENPGLNRKDETLPYVKYVEWSLLSNI